MAQPSPTPVRFPSGVSTDFPYGPLANFGLQNPFSYMVVADDFMDVITGRYTATATGNGSFAKSNGLGGTTLFTTNSSTPAATDIVSIQLTNTAFAYTAGKKMFFATRLQLSSATNAAFRAGFVPTDTSPFTVTDGIYFDKATGSLTNLNLVSMNTSVATTTAIPTTAYTLANNTYIDLAFYVDRSGTINAFVGSQLFGWLPQSGTGSSNPTRGPCAAVTPSISTAALNFMVGIQSGTAASSTMTVDFVLAAVER